MENVSGVIRDAIKVGAQRLKMRDEIMNFMHEISQSYGRELSAELGSKIDVRVENSSSNIPLFQQMFDMSPRPLSTSFQLSAGCEGAMPKERAPILSYDINPSSCYPCYVRWGNKELSCGSFESVQRAVQKALEDESMSVIGRLKQTKKIVVASDKRTSSKKGNKTDRQ